MEDKIIVFIVPYNIMGIMIEIKENRNLKYKEVDIAQNLGFYDSNEKPIKDGNFYKILVDEKLLILLDQPEVNYLFDKKDISDFLSSDNKIYLLHHSKNLDKVVKFQTAVKNKFKQDIETSGPQMERFDNIFYKTFSELLINDEKRDGHFKDLKNLFQEKRKQDSLFEELEPKLEELHYEYDMFNENNFDEIIKKRDAIDFSKYFYI